VLLRYSGVIDAVHVQVADHGHGQDARTCCLVAAVGDHLRAVFTRQILVFL